MAGMSDERALVTDESGRVLAQLEEIAQRVWELIGRPHYHLHDGEPIRDPATGEPLRDDAATLRGIDVQLEVLTLRAQILGLVPPLRYQHHLVDERGGSGN